MQTTERVSKLSVISLNNPNPITLHLHADPIRKAKCHLQFACQEEEEMFNAVYWVIFPMDRFCQFKSVSGLTQQALWLNYHHWPGPFTRKLCVLSFYFWPRCLLGRIGRDITIFESIFSLTPDLEVRTQLAHKCKRTHARESSFFCYYLHLLPFIILLLCLPAFCESIFSAFNPSGKLQCLHPTGSPACSTTLKTNRIDPVTCERLSSTCEKDLNKIKNKK